MFQHAWADSGQSNVLAACGMLLEELQDEIDRQWQIVADSATAQDPDAVTRAMDRTKALKMLNEDAIGLRARLRELLGAPTAPAPGANAASQKLKKGLKTPQAAYRLPILRALVDLGGSADKNVALQRVYAALQSRLNEFDLIPVPSDPNRPRWKVTAEFCRNNLREEGLIASGSPKGLWEISDAGRRWLDAQPR